MGKKLTIIQPLSTNQKKFFYVFVGSIAVTVSALPYLEGYKAIKALLLLIVIGFVAFCLIYSLVLSIKRNFLGKKYLILLKDGVLAGKESFDLESIKSIAIKSDNVRGYSTGFGNTHGQNNFFKIYFVNGRVEEYEFLQTSNTKIKGFRKALISYYKAEKISWQQLIKILELRDRKEILSLKKKLS